MVTINRYIKALLHPAGGHQGSHKAHQAGNQNGCHFADDVFGCIFVNEKVCILIQISLKFVPKGPIDNTPALF